jgi:hypothetical protein
VCMFVVIWVGHAVTRSLGLSAGRALAVTTGKVVPGGMGWGDPPM